MALKRPAAMLLTVALATGTISAFAAPARAGSEESQFVSKHNAARSSRGIGTLSSKSDLVSVARRHSARMAAKGTIWHNPNLANEVGGNWTLLGENVGMGPSVDDLFQAFMDSQHHRENILERSYNQFGVGVVVSDGTIYVTIVFAARKSSASTPTVKRPRARIVHKRALPQKPARPAAAVAKPKPAAPKPVPVLAPRNVSLLVRLVGMDASSEAPAKGNAMGLINFAEQVDLLEI
jgi:hypothetical protein